MINLGRLVDAARERRLFRYLILYAGVAWGIAQVVEFFLDNYGWSPRILDGTLFLLVVGFFVTLTLVWYHGEKGHQRVPRAEALVLACLGAIAVVGVGWVATRDLRPEIVETASFDLGPNSVAVLPFRNEIAAPEFAWLDRGVAELLATDLSQIDTLRVVSGQRIVDLLRQFGIEEDEVVPERLRTRVTQRAGARYLLTGTVVGAPGNLQLVAELSDTRSGVTRASARAGGADLFALIDEVSAVLSADLLGRALTPGESLPVSRLTTPSFDAFREYQEGLTASLRFHSQEAKEHFERAIELDSTFALAHFQLALLHFRQGEVAVSASELELADRHLDEASERDRLYVGGFVDLVRGSEESGLAKLRELLARYPDEKEARIILGVFLSRKPETGEEVERLTRETLELDPLYAAGWNELAYIEARLGNFAAADTLVRRYVELEPGEPNPLDSRGEIAEMAGRYEEARASYREALEVREDFYLSLTHIVRTYLREGRAAEAQDELAGFRASEAADTRTWAWLLTADTRMWAGDIPGALATYDSTIAVAASTGRADLHGTALDQMVRTLVLLERYDDADRWADSLRRVRGPDGVGTVTHLHRLGNAGRLDEMEAEVAGTVAYFRETPALRMFASRAEAGMRLLIAYYRGDYEDVLELAAELGEAAPATPAVQLGYPIIRAALATGDIGAARSGTESLVAATAVDAANRLPPLETRYRDYFRARIAELEGDTATAITGYDRLLREWTDALDDVPLFRDVESRLAALSSPSR